MSVTGLPTTQSTRNQPVGELHKARHATRQVPALAGRDWPFLAVLGVVYVLWYGWILVSSGFLPYVFDGNESYSTYWHAYSLVERGIGQTDGLTDEVFSPHEAASPFVHTHQGNVPRLYVALLYVLGARTVEAQIALVTFTVGVASLALAYRVFRQVSSRRFAVVAGLVLMTDYLLFAQWQVNTYRVWHGFFLFAALACALGVRSPQWRLWLVFTVVNALALFYFELVFVAFVSAMATLLAAWHARSVPRSALGFVAAHAVGGMVAITVLLLQLGAYLGWDGLRDDLSLTYLARNSATGPAGAVSDSPASIHHYHVLIGRLTATDPELQARLRDFYDRHNVIFWWNLVDSSPIRSLRYLVGSLFVWIFQVHTPLLTLLVLTVLGGLALGSIGPPRALRRRFAEVYRQRRPDRTVRVDVPSPAARGRLDPGIGAVSLPPAVHLGLRLAGRMVRMGLLWVAWAALLLTVVRDEAFLGRPLSNASFSAGGLSRMLFVLLGAGAVTLLLVRVTSGGWLGVARLSFPRIVLASALLVGLTLFIRTHGRLYDQEYAPIWLAGITADFPLSLARAAFLATAGVAALLVLVGSRRALGWETCRELRGAAVYLVCGSVAYGLVYLLATGYVLSGYLVRYSPLAVFVVDVAVAVVAIVALQIAARAARDVDRQRQALVRWAVTASVRSPRLSDHPGQLAFVERGAVALAGLAVPGLAGAFLVVCWLNVQRSYVELFPPDHFTALFRTLAAPPYSGAGLVVSTYAAPAAQRTGQWAYFDPSFGVAETPRGDGRVQLTRDLRTWVWLADRDRNPAYLTPPYYLCMAPPSFRGLLDRRLGREQQIGNCRDNPIVRQAATSGLPSFPMQIAAEDRSGRDAWTIVRLDWDGSEHR